LTEHEVALLAELIEGGLSLREIAAKVEGWRGVDRQQRGKAKRPGSPGRFHSLRERNSQGLRKLRFRQLQYRVHQCRDVRASR